MMNADINDDVRGSGGIGFFIRGYCEDEAVSHEGRSVSAPAYRRETTCRYLPDRLADIGWRNERSERIREYTERVEHEEPLGDAYL